MNTKYRQKQVLKFISQWFNLDSEPKITIKFVKLRKYYPAIWQYYNITLKIDLEQLPLKEDMEACLLHEMGHMCDKFKSFSDSKIFLGKREFSAHLWAIMNSPNEKVTNVLLEWAYHWQTLKGTPYIIAAKYLRQLNLIKDLD